MITKLDKNSVFVFGSNLNGHHLGGAAKQAFEQFGAEWGVGEGLTGKCYAFPTLDREMKPVPVKGFKASVNLLKKTCLENKDKVFLLTKVGCGIAGFKESFVKKAFKSQNYYKPNNLILPDDWQ